MRQLKEVNMTSKKTADETAKNLEVTNEELDAKSSLNEQLAADDIRPIVNKEIKSRGAGRKDRKYDIKKVKAEMREQGVKTQFVPGHGKIKID
jgi:hypothetical protein